MIVVQVDNRIRISGLSEDEAKSLYAQFIHKNAKHHSMKAAKIRGWWAEPALIPTWDEDTLGRLSLPRGGMGRVRLFLKNLGKKFRVDDARLKWDEVDVPDTTTELWPHQERIVEACIRKENCLVKSGTGSGKTSALLALHARIKVPTLVVVHSAALADQWVKRAKSELGLKDSEIGRVGGGKRTVRNLTIGIQKSVANLAQTDPPFTTEFGAVFADEVHKFAAKTFFAAIDPFSARYRVGASDDVKRKDKKEFLIHDLFGDVAEEVSDEELVRGGHVMDVEVLCVPTQHRADWYGIPTEEDPTKRPDFGRLLAGMAQDPLRQEAIQGIIAREVAEGRTILVMAHHREHCLAIGQAAAKVARSGYLIGGADYKQEYDRTLAGMKSGKIQVGIGTYQAVGTGIDIPNIEVGIACTPILANKSSFRQSRGRVCRAPKGKTVARFYVLLDPPFAERHLENACRWNEKTFVWDGTQWANGRDYLRQLRRAED